MVKYYINSPDEKRLIQSQTAQTNCWIYMEAPSAEEIAEISLLTEVEEGFLRSALDEEEVAHLDTDDNIRMVVVDIPKMIKREDSCEIFTVPLALIQTGRYFISVCTRPTSVLGDFFLGKIKNADTTRCQKLVYQIMYNNSARFLYYLRQIDKESDVIQSTLSKSMQNKELLQLLGLQKSLVFFSASLTGNFAVIQRIANNSMAKAPEDERDILEDVIIENKQALEMCGVYREIIKSSMDAFASVVNNNQNVVMKILTAITILLSVPMVIAGFWGMNTAVPFEGKLWGFWVATGISIFATAVIFYYMMRKKML